LQKRTNITDLEFVQRAAQQAPMNVEFMNKFYRMLDGKQTVEEMIRAFQLSRIQIIFLIYHLLTNDLIKISNVAVKSTSFAVQPRVIDGAAIQSVMMSLRRADTGMFIYPAFLYFLEQEYFRCYRSRSPLSVIVFEMRLRSGAESRQLLPGPAILDAVLRISQLKRHVDLLAHYDAFDYALLLPNTKANGAQIFANRLVRALTASPLGGEVDASKLSLSMGCSSIPEDFVDLSSLLGAADLAMAQAKSQNKPVIMYRDIKPITV
jgi:diguanylate cyclase (GGDEF)-like protein